MGNRKHVGPIYVVQEAYRVRPLASGKRSCVPPNTDAEKNSVATLLACVFVRRPAMARAYHPNLYITHSQLASVNSEKRGGRKTVMPKCQHCCVVTAGNRNSCSSPCKGILADPALTHTIPKGVTMRSYFRTRSTTMCFDKEIFLDWSLAFFNSRVVLTLSLLALSS